MIQKRLVDRLALALLQGEFAAGDLVEVDAVDGELVFTRAARPVAPTLRLQRLDLLLEDGLLTWKAIETRGFVVTAYLRTVSTWKVHRPNSYLNGKSAISPVLSAPQTSSVVPIRSVFLCFPLGRM